MNKSITDKNVNRKAQYQTTHINLTHTKKRKKTHAHVNTEENRLKFQFLVSMRESNHIYKDKLYILKL